MPGSFRIDQLDPTTNAVTGRPITSAASVARKLAMDRYGQWQWVMSTADPALATIEGKNFQVYWQHDNVTYNLGRCSYLDHVIEAGRDDGVARVRCAGGLRDLTRQTVLKRSFDGAADDVNDVLSTIVPLRSGWSLGSVDTITNAAPMDFWYESIFEAVSLLALTFGYHFREGTTSQTLDFGALGASSGVLAVGGGQQLPPAVYGNAQLCQISRLSVHYQGREVINRLIPFGGALGVATIDLSETVVTQPGYAVQSASLPGGGTYYYIEDSASQTSYGLTERRFLRKDLRPIVNTPAARQFAADILYEATLASLLNLKDRQVVYTMEVVGLQPGQVRVGDKINVVYRGWVDTPAGAQQWLEVDGASAGQGQEFYVLEIDETFGDGVTSRLRINENAVHPETVEDLLASTIQEFERSQIHVQPTVTVYTTGPYVKRADTTVDAEFSFNIGSETLTVVYAKMKIVGEPLKSSVQASAGGSEHSHSVTIGSSGSHDHDTITFNRQLTSVQNSNHKALYIHQNDEDFHFFTNDSGPSTTVPASSSDPHTHPATATTGESAHTHGMTYGLFEDSTRPDTLTIKLNGTTIASGVTLSAPDYDYELDITSDLLAEATLQQDHEITVSPGSGRGEIVFQIQILSVIQPIEVT